MKRTFLRPSPASVIAVLALVVATSGSAYAVSSTLHNGDTLIAKNSLSANRIRTHTITTTQVAPLAWTGLILQSSWSPAGRAPKAATDAQGIVHLEGAVKGGTSTTIGTVPKSAAPRVTIYLTAHNNKGGTIGIVVQTTGAVIVQEKLGPNTYVGLDGISFAR